MNDPEIADSERLVEALRAHEPNALAALFDAYADRLFRYCWLLLRNRDIAQVALRDTLVAAHAHIGRLPDPSSFRSWLYALARTECRRRRPVPAAEADEPAARPSQADADSRLMAWHAVTSMDAAEIEALELTCRHDVDLELVLGMSALDARALLDRANRELERALGAEILVSRGSLACPDRAEVMRGWAGTVTAQLRERVHRHAAACPVCGPSLPRNVSAARVFALLPEVPLPSGARTRVLDFAVDPQTAAYRDFAVARAVSNNQAPAGRGGGGGTTRIRILAVATVAMAAATVASMIVLGSGPGGSRSPSGLNPAAVGSARTPPWRREGAGVAGAFPAGPRPTRAAAFPAPVSHVTTTTGVTKFTRLTKPLSATPRPGPPPGPSPVPPTVPPRVPGGPVSAPSPPPAPKSSLTVTPSTLDVASGSQGEIVLTARGRPQAWSASTSSGAISISGYSGTLQAGQSVILVVVISRTGHSGGSAFVYLDRGTATAQTVQVFWSTCPPEPEPRPVPRPRHRSQRADGAIDPVRACRWCQ